MTISNFIKTLDTKNHPFYDYELYMLIHSYITMLSDVDGDILELGCYTGSSSIVIGEASKRSNSKLHFVDMFPELSEWELKNDRYVLNNNLYDNDDYITKEFFNRSILPAYNKSESLYKNFVANLKENNIENYTVYKTTTDEFFNKNIKRYKFIFVDAGHSYEQAKRDIINAKRDLMPGGWILIDDLKYNDVQQAVNEEITREHFKHIHNPTINTILAKRK